MRTPATPRPWTYETIRTPGRRPYFRLRTPNAALTPIGHVSTKADAVFIVTACNLHHQLIESLELAHQTLMTMAKHGDSIAPLHVRQTIEDTLAHTHKPLPQRPIRKT